MLLWWGEAAVPVGQGGVKVSFLYRGQNLSCTYILPLLPLTLVNFKSKLESPTASSKESFQLLPEETLIRTQLFILDVAFDIGGPATRDYYPATRRHCLLCTDCCHCCAIMWNVFTGLILPNGCMSAQLRAHSQEAVSTWNMLFPW